MLKSLLALIMLAPMLAWGQFYTLSVDSQNPGQSFVVSPQFSGNTPFLRSLHYDGGTPIDMTPWSCEIDMFLSQYDTNGVFIIPGVSVAGSNVVNFVGATNIFYAPRKYYFSLKGIHTAGYVKTFATGIMDIKYDPATSSNLWAALQQLNVSWFSNNFGAQVESNRLNIAALTATFNSTSGQMTTAIGTLTTNLAAEVSRATNAETVISNAYVAAIVVETSRATNAEAGISNYVNTAVAVETTRATNSEAYLQTEITSMSLSSNTIYRYVAMTNGNNQMEVLASALGVTATLAGTEITTTIPTGARIFSVKIRWDGVNLGSSLTLDMGVGDMANDDVSDRWGALFQAYREDTGALIAGASCRLDTANYSKLLIQGLSTATENHLRLGF